MKRPAKAEMFYTDKSTDKQTDGRRDMTKLIVAFRNFSKAPKANKIHRLQGETPNWLQNISYMFLPSWASIKKIAVVE